MGLCFAKVDVKDVTTDIAHREDVKGVPNGLELRAIMRAFVALKDEEVVGVSSDAMVSARSESEEMRRLREEVRRLKEEKEATRRTLGLGILGAERELSRPRSQRKRSSPTEL